MQSPLKKLIESYDAGLPLAEASAPPAAWYTDPRIFELEQRTVFARSWQVAARADQLREVGQYITSGIAGDPIIVVKGNDGVVRGFFNVCRHKGAAITTEPQGRARTLRCPYHGWTYTLEGELKGAPDFTGVKNFDPSVNGLVSVQTGVWQNWVFAKVDPDGPSLEDFLGGDLTERMTSLEIKNLHWFERRHYMLSCNWKVFVDNYLDGGYHVPHLHHGLNSVLSYGGYTIENGEHYCVQSA